MESIFFVYKVYYKIIYTSDLGIGDRKLNWKKCSVKDVLIVFSYSFFNDINFSRLHYCNYGDNKNNTYMNRFICYI